MKLLTLTWKYDDSRGSSASKSSNNIAPSSVRGLKDLCPVFKHLKIISIEVRAQWLCTDVLQPVVQISNNIRYSRLHGRNNRFRNSGAMEIQR